jgi:hypothetical protein
LTGVAANAHPGSARVSANASAASFLNMAFFLGG